jgi:outer membrane protein assembly factor BamD (BamD/ComL family)
VPSRVQTIFIAAFFLLCTGSAPVQCARDPDPDRAIEEEPGEALYGLAEQFRERGDTKARKDTLAYLVQRYPSSRFAARAKQELDELGASRDVAKGP